MTTISLALASLLLPTNASAQPEQLRCNSDQSRCVIDATYLTVGDRVGVFNGDGELVAEGRVRKLRGTRRTVKINKRHGRIHQGDRLALLEGDRAVVKTRSDYRVFRKPSQMKAGGHIAIGRMNLGEGSPATDFGVFGEYHQTHGLYWVARGSYFAVEGTATRPADLYGLESASVSIRGLGLLGGASYYLRQSKPISFRTELMLGTAYMMASVDGDTGLVSGAGYDTKVENGFVPAARGSLGAIYNTGAWHWHLDVAPMLAKSAVISTIVGGVSKDIE